MKIKVMTYNVQSGKNDEKPIERDYAFCSEVIKKSGADIIGLNELGRHSHGEKFPKLELGMEPDEYLGKKLGLNHAFGQAIITRDSCPYGNGILTRMPILNAKTVMIPDTRKHLGGHYETRSVLVTKLNINNGLTILVSHFGLEKEERENAVETVVQIIDQTDTPLILMGDFNCTPDDPVLIPLYERLTDTNNGQLAPHTWPANPENHKDEASLKIDYIFTSEGIKILSVNVIETAASDHKPMICEIEI